MERRELLQLIAAATGCALFGDAGAVAVVAPAAFSAKDIAFFDEVAETILPRTDTPGAKDAKVGAFIASYSVACYSPEELAVLRAGIGELDAGMRAAQGIGFMKAKPKQRQAFLSELDRAAKAHAKSKAEGAPPHYFTLMKQLTLLGFFTSEPGATKVARYRPNPGPYKGCVDLKPGDTFWFWG